MEKISNRLVKYLLDSQASSHEFDDVRFGIELILTQTTLLLSIIVIGILFNSMEATKIEFKYYYNLRSYFYKMLEGFLCSGRSKITKKNLKRGQIK